MRSPTSFILTHENADFDAIAALAAAAAIGLLNALLWPLLTYVLLPFAVLVALSRMILGLHYPSDVLAGALIGLALAMASFNLFRPSGFY